MLLPRENPRGIIGEELFFARQTKLNSGPQGTFSGCLLLMVLEPQDQEGVAHLRCHTQRAAQLLYLPQQTLRIEIKYKSIFQGVWGTAIVFFFESHSRAGYLVAYVLQPE